jgi:hypothetical protein
LVAAVAAAEGEGERRQTEASGYEEEEFHQCQIKETE